MTDRRNIPLAAGLLMLPALVFQDSLVPLAVQVTFLIVLQLILKRRVRIMPNVIMIAVITGVNLVQPYGRIFITVMGLPITQGALELGLRRSLTLIGLIYLSRFMVIHNPRFPGKIGSLLSLQFTYYESFLQNRINFRPKHIIESLDSLLTELEEGTENPLPGKRTSSPAFSLLPAAVPILFWGIFLAGSFMDL